MTDHLLDRIAHAPFIPTSFPLAPEVLGPFIHLLHAEDYPALEILCRPAEDALAVVRQLNNRPERPSIALGIGTILTERLARRAVELKPDFLVSPAFSRKVLHVARQENIPYIPAVRTFQDVQTVLEAFEEEDVPLRLLKLCPVAGLNHEYLQMLGGCFPGIRYCPTGEVTLENYAYWKSSPFIATPMGSRFVPRDLLETGQFDRAREILKDMRRMSESVSVANP